MFCQGKMLLHARQSAYISHIAIAFNAHNVDVLLLELSQQGGHALPDPAKESKGLLNIIYCQPGSQGDAFRRNDIAEFTPPDALNFNETFFNQPFQVPIDRSNRNAQVLCKLCLGDIRVRFNALQQGQIAVFFITMI